MHNFLFLHVYVYHELLANLFSLIYFNSTYIFPNYSLLKPSLMNLVRIGCKTYVLHHLIRDYHISILLKI